MLVTLHYDEASGQLTTKNGMLITNYSGLQTEETKETNRIDDLVTLKSAGFTVEEIIELRKKEMI